MQFRHLMLSVGYHMHTSIFFQRIQCVIIIGLLLKSIKFVLCILEKLLVKVYYAVDLLS